MSENTIPVTPDDDETATEESAVPAATAPAPAPAPAADPADLTRLASEAEIADLRRLRSAGPARRRTFLTVVALALVGFIAAAIAHVVSRQESAITYPQGSDVRRLVDVGGAKLLVYWPGNADTVVTGDGTNRLDVVTGVGRNRDVPMHLAMTHTVLTNGLVATTRQTYDAWLGARVAEGWNFDAGSEKTVFVNTTASGYPAQSIDYERTSGPSRLAGRVLYVRHIDHELVLLREFPLVDRARAEDLLDGYLCLAANLSAVTARFEVPERGARVPGNVTDLITGANSEVLNNFPDADWPAVDLALRTVLVETRERHDEAKTRRATELYETFRLQMQNWYIRQCLEFNEARDENSDDISRKVTREGIRTRVRLETARRLPKAGDCRQERIARDDWSIQ